MTLPTLPPCTVPDCPAPIVHWHGCDGYVFACHATLNGKPCPHGDPACYAPRETAPLHLPDVDTVARAIYESDDHPIDSWATQNEDVKDSYRANARDVLDLIAAHQPVWQRVEPGTLIKGGTRYRRETLNGSFWERIAAGDFLTGDGNISIDSRTIPAPTLTERIRAALDDSPESRITLDVADVEALLDMAGGEDK